MAISTEERAKIAATFTKIMPTMSKMLKDYTAEAGAPERFWLGVFDGSDAGGDWGNDVAPRLIAEHEIRTAEWINDHQAIGGKKVRAALRTGINTGIHARSGGTFTEDEVPYPGGCIGEVNGNKIVVSTSGLRGTEDEPFSLLIIELLQRALNPA